MQYSGNTRVRTCMLLLATAALCAMPVLGAGSKKKGDSEKETVSKRLPDALRQPMAMVDALNIAAVHNGNILQARQEVEAAFGVAIQTRAIVLPKLIGSAQYQAETDSLIPRAESSTKNISVGSLGVISIPGQESALTNNQNWNSTIQISQSIYEGGRLISAVKSAKLIREAALYNYQTVVADNLLEVTIAYDDALSAAQQIVVRQQAIVYLKSQLDITQKRYDVGILTEFEVLRAQVELADAEPPLITAQNEYIIAKQKLVQLMGYDLSPDAANDLPLKLTTPLLARPYPDELSASITKAFASRSELLALRTAEKLRVQGVVNARSGYKPSVQAFAGNEVTSDVYSRNAGDNLNGWVAGAQLSWPIFDGLLTKGQVDEAVALERKAKLQTDQVTREIQLQVRTDWSHLLRAKAILAALVDNISKAEEALRLADVRYDAGTVTQLDVLSAQTSLTETRAQYVQALRDYSVSRSKLERSVGANFVSPTLTDANPARKTSVKSRGAAKSK